MSFELSTVLVADKVFLLVESQKVFHVLPGCVQPLFAFQDVVDVRHGEDVLVCVDVLYASALHVQENTCLQETTRKSIVGEEGEWIQLWLRPRTDLLHSYEVIGCDPPINKTDIRQQPFVLGLRQFAAGDGLQKDGMTVNVGCENACGSP